MKIRTGISLIVILTATMTTAFAQSGDVYKAKCQSCHGSAGIPNPGITKAMGVKPGPIHR